MIDAVGSVAMTAESMKLETKPILFLPVTSVMKSGRKKMGRNESLNSRLSLEESRVRKNAAISEIRNPTTRRRLCCLKCRSPLPRNSPKT